MNIPEEMQAVKLEKPDGKLVVRTVRVPRPKKGEVLVKISAAPINPSDLQRIRSISDEEQLSLFIPGLEGSGTVVAAGKGLLSALWLGKRVACSASQAESGTWAEYMVTAASYCFPLPKSISDEQGSMYLVNPMTALAFFDLIKKERHKAIINPAAAGALGAMIRILGRKYSIPVINVVRNELQGKILSEEGEKYVLNNTDDAFADQLRMLSLELKATLALDPVAGTFTQQLLDAIPYGGTVLIYGNLSGSDQGTNLRPLLIDNKKLHGFYLVNWLKDNSLTKTILNLYRVRQLLKNEIQIAVQNRFPLDEAQIAIDTYLNNMSKGKTLLVPKNRGTLNSVLHEL